jgi:hypothetical protein
VSPFFTRLFFLFEGKLFIGVGCLHGLLHLGLGGEK